MQMETPSAMDIFRKRATSFAAGLYVASSLFTGAPGMVQPAYAAKDGENGLHILYYLQEFTVSAANDAAAIGTTAIPDVSDFTTLVVCINFIRKCIFLM